MTVSRERAMKHLYELTHPNTLTLGQTLVEKGVEIHGYITALESKITTLRNAAEIGLTYVLAAQRGLTFTKPRMASDVEVFNDALKMRGDE